MTQAGEVRYVDVDGTGDWVVYVRDQVGVWMPVDLGGPGYLTDNTIKTKKWMARP